MPIFIALGPDLIPGVDGVMLKWMIDITVYFNGPYLTPSDTPFP